MKNWDDVKSEMDEVLNSAKNGNFDEVLAKTKQYAERATKKGAQQFEISKKRIELLEAKTKLSKAFEKYGRLMYALENGETAEEDALASALAEIQLHKTRSDMLTQDIETMREDYASSPEQEAPESIADVEVIEVEPAEE